MDDKKIGKLYKFKLSKQVRTMHNMCISIEGTVVKFLASEFQVTMEIMKRHYRGYFWKTLYVS